MERLRMHYAEMPGMSRIFLRFRSRCECIQSLLKRQTQKAAFEMFVFQMLRYLLSVSGFYRSPYIFFKPVLT
jgi:hypothetical protein